jgi:N-acetylglutamate synthase-like GNAT family acetyltransferase
MIDKLEDRVVGHASLLRIGVKTNDGTIENLAFLQSLIVDKELRGKGLGKKMMSYSELYLVKFAQRQKILNLKDITKCEYLYLTTKDKQLFYEAIGYETTEPLLFYSVKNSNSRCNRIMNDLLASFKPPEHPFANNRTPEQLIQITPHQSQALMAIHSIPPPPPPPPPPMPSKSQNEKEIIDKKKDNSYIVAESSWYRKRMKLKSNELE